MRMAGVVAATLSHRDLIVCMSLSKNAVMSVCIDGVYLSECVFVSYFVQALWKLMSKMFVFKFHLNMITDH